MHLCTEGLFIESPQGSPPLISSSATPCNQMQLSGLCFDNYFMSLDGDDKGIIYSKDGTGDISEMGGVDPDESFVSLYPALTIASKEESVLERN